MSVRVQIKFPLQLPNDAGNVRTVGIPAAQLGHRPVAAGTARCPHHATKVIISSNAQYRNDGMPYARQATIQDPGVAVYFKRKGKDMVFACDTYWNLHDNIHAIAKTIEALRAIERWGASDMLDRAFTGFTALPAPIAAGMKRDWQVVLGLQELVLPDADDVRNAYQRLASQYHTDKPGGDHDKMAELNAARDEALQELSK